MAPPANGGVVALAVLAGLGGHGLEELGNALPHGLLGVSSPDSSPHPPICTPHGLQLFRQVPHLQPIPGYLTQSPRCVTGVSSQLLLPCLLPPM